MANNTDTQRDPEEPIDPKRRKVDLAAISGSESESENEAPEQVVPNGHNADSADTESLPDDM